MFRSLMSSRRFAPLFWCQFFAAFNDNFLKNALVIIILFRLGSAHGEALVMLGAAVFIAPYFLLSALGGELADRYDKAIVAQRLKFNEIGAAGIAVVGFLLQSVPILFIALFLFGALAALFTPTKYGVLPDHLSPPELPAGNALVEAATFLAILLGTIVGGVAAASGSSVALVALVVVFAVLAWLAARQIPPTGEAAPNLKINVNLFRSTGLIVRDVWRDARIWRATLMVSWFWTIGAVVLALLPALVKDDIAGSAGVVTIYLALFSIGIAIGSFAASWLCGGRIILLPTVIGAVLMAVFMLDAGLAAGPSAALVTPETFLQNATAIRLGVDFVGLAFAGGLFIVPCFTAVQLWAEKSERARIIGGLNVVSSVSMVLGTVAIAGLQTLGMRTTSILLLLAALNVVAAVLIFRALPTNRLADFLWILFRLLFRIELRGEENLAKGGANPILACNHVSYLDGPLVLSFVERNPVFAVDLGMSKKWWVRLFLRFTRAMPLDPAKPMATRTLINAVKAGDPLIIFPEGRLTVTGGLMKVYDGAALVAERTGALLLPVKIDGADRTYLTRLSGDQIRRSWWPKIVVSVLEPVKLTVDNRLRGRARRRAAGAALHAIMADLLFRTAPTSETIIEAVVGAARKHGFHRVVVEDPTSGTLTAKRFLAAAAVLGRKFIPFAAQRGAVGVLLPNSIAAGVTVLGLMSSGRVAAMMNFTAGPANILAACKAAEVRTVITSRTFVEKGKLDDLITALAAEVEISYLEDMRKTVSTPDRLRGLLHAKRPLVESQPDDPAVIVFTSGSEGAPKGVVLSHRNVLSNVAQGAAVLDFGPADTLFSALPIFHSFGLTIGFLFPLVSGVKTFFYPSPLHYRAIPEAIYASNSTILLGTDTFLAGYAKAAHDYDFRSLRYVISGAEPVKEATRRVYMERFGLRILEGYGMTEASPAVSFNTPMASRSGTVGRVLPGMEVRLEPVPGIDDGGRLFVRGPNVMLGYLKVDRPGVIEKPADGWHDTGDIVALDDDGFVMIRGRAKRFAKIGGEMVSLAAIEALAAELWPESPTAVTNVPDARKGERLILVTEAPCATRAGFHAYARERGATELMVPAEVIHVEKVPAFASGKVDHPAVARLVADLLAAKAPASEAKTTETAAA